MKARRHFGATSLDLTIPASVCVRLGLEVGDVWTVEARLDGNVPVLVYARTAKAPPPAVPRIAVDVGAHRNGPEATKARRKKVT